MFSLFINTLLLLISGYFFLTSILFLVEIVVQIFIIRDSYTELSQDENKQHVRSVILIPAHNEKDVIDNTINSLKPALEEWDQIIVIADNCTDDTASISRSCGAVVYERDDLNLKGKSHALHFGRELLVKYKPDVVFNIDADCDCSMLDISYMKKLALHKHAPIQCHYEMLPSENESLSSRLSAFAWWIKNHVRATGASTLGMPCQLMGSGMVFPLDIFQKIDFSANALAEDLQIGLELSYQGYESYYLSSSKVVSRFQVGDKASETQKTRWIHGHLSTIFNIAMPLMMRSLFSGKWKSLFQCIDASFPPITFTLPILLLFILTTYILSGMEFASYILMLSLLFTLMGLIIAFAFKDNKFINHRDIIRIPLLVLKKLYIPFSYFFNKQKSWIKTDRDE